jgi:WD40 repeat protein
VVWTPDGGRLFSSGKDATIRVWDAIHSRNLPRRGDVNARPAFSPDERWVAVRHGDETVAVLEARSGFERLRLTNILELGGFSPDGRALQVVAMGPAYESYSLETGERQSSLPLRNLSGSLTKRILTADGHWYVSGFNSGEVIVQDLQRGGETFSLVGHQEMIVALAVSPDGRQLVTGSIDRVAKLWDLTNRREVRSFTGHRMAVGSVAFSADNHLLATGSWDDTVQVWDARSGERLNAFTGLTEGVQDVAFAPMGRTLAVLSGAGRLTFWSLAASREAGAERLPRGVGGGWLQFSAGGRWLGAVAPGREMTLIRGQVPELSPTPALHQ